MPDIGVAPPMVPYGADQTIYLVVDCGAPGNSCCENEIERSDRDGLIAEMLAGRFCAPDRVIAFNTLEHWRRDISNEIAAEICVLCDIEGIAVPDYLGDFVERCTCRASQGAL